MSAAENRIVLAIDSCFFFQAEDGIRDRDVTGVQTCALPIYLPSRKVLQVLSIGSWTTLEVGERLIERGKLPETGSLIVRGKVRVTRDGRVLGELIAGDVVGSALIFSSIPAQVDAVVLEPGRAMRWQSATLERYLAANPETRTIMLQHVAHDLAEKVERATRADRNRSDKTQ